MPKCPFCAEHIALGALTCPHCHAPISDSQAQLSEDLEQRVRSVLEHGDKIEAIKIYREETGAGLAEAKSAVEALESGREPSIGDGSVDSDLEAEVLRLLGERKKIQAIKLYRERTGVGLKDAKDAVEAMATRHGVASQGTGCAGVIVVILLIGAVAALAI